MSRSVTRVFAYWRTGLSGPAIVRQAGTAVNYFGSGLILPFEIKSDSGPVAPRAGYRRDARIRSGTDGARQSFAPSPAQPVEHRPRRLTGRSGRPLPDRDRQTFTGNKGVLRGRTRQAAWVGSSRTGATVPRRHT